MGESYYFIESKHNGKMAASKVLYFYGKLVAYVRQATQSATMNAEDLEEVWERAITVARVDLPNRCARGGAWGMEKRTCGRRRKRRQFLSQAAAALALNELRLFCYTRIFIKGARFDVIT